MASSAPTSISSAQAQELQRQLESIILKMEKAGLLQQQAGDHVRVIAAEGIAEHFGDRYRAYPTVPRPNNVAIRRDAVPSPCVLAAPARTKHVKKKGVEPVATARTNASSPGKTVTAATSRGATRRVSAWAAGVANASSASTSPEKSITYETRLAANTSRWDAILDNPIKLSSSASRGSYALSGRKIQKRAVSSPSPTKDGSTTKLSGTIKTGNIKAEGSALDAFFGTSACASPAKTTNNPTPETTAAPETAETVDYNDWLIDLSS